MSKPYQVIERSRLVGTLIGVVVCYAVLTFGITYLYRHGYLYMGPGKNRFHTPTSTTGLEVILLPSMFIFFLRASKQLSVDPEGLRLERSIYWKRGKYTEIISKNDISEMSLEWKKRKGERYGAMIRVMTHAGKKYSFAMEIVENPDQFEDELKKYGYSVRSQEA